MKNTAILLITSLIISLLIGCTPSSKKSKLTFQVSFSDSLTQDPQDGRLVLLLSNNDEKEPRFQLVDGLQSQLGFGLDVDGMKPGEQASFDADIFGYPVESLDDIPPGDYYIQALLNRYETYQLSTGHSVKLPPERGEGQQWNRKPGNFYSEPVKITIDNSGANFSIMMDKVIPAVETPEDTEFVKHIRIKSKKLSALWGTDVYLGTHVLLPKDFDKHPEVRYPLMIFHGHFPADFGDFRAEPPDPDLEPDYSDRFQVKGYNTIVQQEAHNFYKTWTSDDFPRMLIIEIQHANPYYDDSYAVNSANIGPYGDAITYELIPYIEEQFRGIGEGWARFLYGGSTGGWEALAAQVFYPDEYNGCFAACLLLHNCTLSSDDLSRTLPG